MKLFVLLTFMLLAVSTVNAGKKTDEERFAKKKARMQENINKRLQQMQSHQSCVNGASNLAGLEQCRAQQKAANDRFKQEWQARKANKANKKAKK